MMHHKPMALNNFSEMTLAIGRCLPQAIACQRSAAAHLEHELIVDDLVRQRGVHGLLRKLALWQRHQVVGLHGVHALSCMHSMIRAHVGARWNCRIASLGLLCIRMAQAKQTLDQ